MVQCKNWESKKNVLKRKNKRRWQKKEKRKKNTTDKGIDESTKKKQYAGLH